MDAYTLRAILSAQAASQAAAQEKMLQAVMKEIPTTAHVTSAEFVTNSLSARLPEFTHDPENGCTFDVWYNEDIITQDGATLDDEERTRLIVSKLDAAADARFTNQILPRRAAEIPLAETVKTLQELFGHNTSVFARRYAYLKIQCNGESLRDYTGGTHWAKECDFMEKRCHACNRVGHKKGFCKNFNRTRTSKLKRKRKRASQVVIAASTTTDIAPIRCISRTVEINEVSMRMRLDTGTNVAFLRHKDWIAMGRPRLLPLLFTLMSANNKKNNVRDHFKCTFAIDGRQGKGTCHVADTASLLGLDRILQVQPLFQRLIESVTCSAVSASTLTAVRTSLTTRLQKQFPAVFAPGLGRCTKSKAPLKLKTDAVPVFRKARSVPYAVQPRITQEIDRLVAANVLTPVEHSEWAAPVVALRRIFCRFERRSGAAPASIANSRRYFYQAQRREILLPTGLSRSVTANGNG
ncbi:hypothetical protein TELCIR_01570 [Teladorsagia circumcincta]|uniref:DUF7083 domain-containing protein n=1 Tax=Teladorsagia circumcincta TaxID=45464 RepID=A0A2G9V1K9_TELCI|nr:hypothetical protein TELCIR_01570 [Teladorsagia circumcincta]